MSKPRHPFFKKLPTNTKAPRLAEAPKGAPVIVEGVLQLKGKFGFALFEDPKFGDVMVQGPSLRLAMGGDRVQSRVTSKPGEPRRSGEITKVLIHSHQTVVGAFRRMGNLPVVVPEDEAPMIHLVDMQSFVPHVGDIVTARIQTWATEKDAA